jgi:replicative DNA helicase
MNETRTMPHALDAERAVLGAPLIAPRLMVELVAALETDDFFLPAHREIFDALVETARRDKPADVLLVGDILRERDRLKMLEGGESYLLSLANAVPTVEHFESYLGIVRDRSTQRRLIHVSKTIESFGYGDVVDTGAMLSEAMEALTALSLRRAGRRKLAPIAASVEATLEALQARQERGGALEGVSTGIEALDRELGGLRPENKYEIAARPGVGKTALAMSIARGHAKRVNATVLVFSLEMPSQQLIERLISAEGSIDSATLRNARLNIEQWKTHVIPASQVLQPLPLYIVDDQYTIGEVEATAHRWRAMHPDADGLIVVDYLQLFDVGHARGQSTSDAIGMVSKRIKRLAKKLKVPIIELSQLNRESEKESRRPRLSDLRASGDIEQDADAVIFIHDEGVRDDRDELVRTTDGPVELIIAKNRHGAQGRAKAHWCARHYTFTDVETRRMDAGRVPYADE